MSKSAALKQITALAHSLPACGKTVRTGNQAKGSTLLAAGIKEIGGRAVEPNEVYDQTKQVKVNHEKTMRRLFFKKGMGAVAGYVETINKLKQSKHETNI